VPQTAFVVQRAFDVDAEGELVNPTIISTVLDLNETWVGIDSVAAWPAGQVAWYKVLIMLGPQGPVMASSPAQQPYEQTGETTKCTRGGRSESEIRFAWDVTPLPAVLLGAPLHDGQKQSSIPSTNSCSSPG
jgi:hypothetical protein